MAPLHHPPTVVLPNLPKQALVGIDLLSLTASSRFNGFTALPSGWHFLFIGATAELSSRQGVWFYVPELGEAPRSHAGQKRSRADSQPLGVRGAVIKSTGTNTTPKDWLAVLKWDIETENLTAVEDASEIEQWRTRLLQNPDLQKSLFPYRQSVPPEQPTQSGEGGTQADEIPMDFASLSDHISGPLLERICGQSGGEIWSLDTASSADVDADAEHIPGLEGDERFQTEPLGLSNIDLKRTWPDDAVGRERTEAARDRSWRLQDVVSRSSFDLPAEVPADGSSGIVEDWGADLLGEMQFCFIAVLTLANWSCMAAWRRMLELVLTCYSIVPKRTEFFKSFLRILSTQLTHTNLVEGGLFDVSDEGGEFLRSLLRRFSSTIDELGREHSGGKMEALRTEMRKLQNTVKDIWGWDLGNEWVRKGMVQLEDGEMVELETQEMEDEDERGEFAPVIVECE